MVLVLYLMSLIGGRYCNVVKLRYCDVVVERDADLGVGIRVIYRGGKTFEGVEDAHQEIDWVAENAIPTPEGWDEFIKELDNNATSTVRPFEGDESNKCLAQMRAGKVGLTTYCFRKHFAARIYAHSGRDSQEVARRMGHKNPRMAPAFYLTAGMIPVVEMYEALMPENRRGKQRVLKIPLLDDEKLQEVLSGVSKRRAKVLKPKKEVVMKETTSGRKKPVASKQTKKADPRKK